MIVLLVGDPSAANDFLIPDRASDDGSEASFLR